MIGIELGVPGLGSGLTGLPGLVLDFAGGTRSVNGVGYASLTAMPGWSFSRTGVGTARATNGSIAAFASGVPRITDRGLTLEETRTNHLPWANDFTQGISNTSNATVTADYAVAPDGTMSADRLQLTAASAYRYTRGLSLPSGVTYVGSVWLRAAAAQSVRLRIGTPAQSLASTAAVTTTWQRFSIAIASTGSGTHELGIDNRTAVAGGDGLTKDIEVWGWQLETGAVATSLIPTTGAAATRGAEAAAITAPAGVSGWSATYNAGQTVTGAIAGGASLDLVTGRPWLNGVLQSVTMQ